MRLTQAQIEMPKCVKLIKECFGEGDLEFKKSSNFGDKARKARDKSFLNED